MQLARFCLGARSAGDTKVLQIAADTWETDIGYYTELSLDCRVETAW
jgi:hypothetical protein